jgi:hypothetical protein
MLTRYSELRRFTLAGRRYARARNCLPLCLTQGWRQPERDVDWRQPEAGCGQDVKRALQRSIRRCTYGAAAQAAGANRRARIALGTPYSTLPSQLNDLPTPVKLPVRPVTHGVITCRGGLRSVNAQPQPCWTS